jgi:hypothetical protein
MKEFHFCTNKSIQIINHQVNSTFQLQIDAIRSAADDMEKVESIIMQKKELLKNSKDVRESERLFAELDGLA